MVSFQKTKHLSMLNVPSPKATTDSRLLLLGDEILHSHHLVLTPVVSCGVENRALQSLESNPQLSFATRVEDWV